MRGWLLVVLAVVAATVALAYLATDGAFRSLWFPKLAEAAGLEASAAEATWDPLSGFVARGVRFVGGDGVSGEVEEIQASWNPAEILRATVSLNSLSVTGARVEWVRGKRRGREAEAREKEPKRMGVPTVLGFAVECGPVAFRGIDLVARSVRGGLSLTNRIEAIELSGWRPGTEARAKARVRMAGSVWDGLELEDALLSCDMRLSLTQKLEINGAQGWVRFGECRGRSGEMSLDGLEIEKNILLTPYWLRSAVVTATLGGRPLGRCAANGAVDFNLRTCDLVWLIEDVEPELVSAATASRGLWMTAGKIRLSGQYQVLKESMRVQGEAEMKGACFDRQPGPSAFPPIEGRCAFAAEHFPGAKELVVERAQVSLVEGDSVVAAAGLDRPMRLAWGKKSKRGEPAELALRVPDTELARVAHFIEAACGARVSGGVVGGRGRLLASPDGSEVSWEGSLAARGLAGQWRGESLEGISVGAESVGKWVGGSVLRLSNAVFRVEGPEEKRASVALSGWRSEAGESWKLAGAVGRDWLRGWAGGRFAVARGSVEGSAERVRGEDGAGTLKWDVSAMGLSGAGGALQLRDGGGKVSGELRYGAGGEEGLWGRAVILSGEGAPSGELLVEGPWRDAGGNGRLEARIRGWSEGFLKNVLRPDLAARVGAGTSLDGLAVIGRQAGSWAIDGTGALRGARLGDAPEGPAEGTDLVLAVRGRWAADRFEIEAGSLTAGQVSGADNRLAFAGHVGTDGSGMDVRVTGEVLDPSPFIPMLFAGVGSGEGVLPEGKPPVATDGGRGAGDGGAGGGARARDDGGGIRVEVARLRLGDVEAKFEGQLARADSRWRGGTAVLVAGDGRLDCRIDFPKRGDWAIEARADAFPVVAAAPFVKISGDCLTGTIAGNASLSGGGGWDARALRGVGQLTWSGASGEKFPAVRSFLKSAGKRVTPRLAECRVTGLSGSFEAREGRARTEDLSLVGDLMKLWYAGSIDHRGEIEGSVRFAGRTEVMREARVRLGSVEVGGSTFVAFGRGDGDFTVLPGSLPVRGNVDGEVETDWDGWLKSAGLGAISGLIENLGGARERKEKAEKGRGEED